MSDEAWLKECAEEFMEPTSRSSENRIGAGIVKLLAERDQLNEIHNEIVDTLEARGWFHCGNGDSIGAILDDFNSKLTTAREAMEKARDIIAAEWGEAEFIDEALTKIGG